MPADEMPSLSCCSRILLRSATRLALLLTIAAALPAPLAVASDQLFGSAGKYLNPATSRDGSARYSKALDSEGLYRITADFRTLRGDPLSISFMIEQAAGRASMEEFGISEAELDALKKACLRTRDCDQDEFDQRLMRYYHEHKLRLRTVPGERSHLFVDIPEVVRRNRMSVRPVAAALQQLGAERGHDSDWTFEAAVALVQGGLEYRKPSSRESGRQTLGFYTPPRALEKGYGDCDTKSALLAAILLNLGDARIIGVRVRDHYLLGISRAPQDGEAFLNFQGEPFVLVEASGPAQRRPGDISERTRAALNSRDAIRIDPMF